MDKPSPPSAPDPYSTAAAQYQYGTQAAAYNKTLGDVNTSGPTGSTQFTSGGYDPMTGAPITNETTTLSAPEQALLSGSQTAGLNQQSAGESALSDWLNQSQIEAPDHPLTYGASGGPIQTSLGIDPSNLQGFYDKSFNTALAGNMAAITPQLNNQYEQLDASLRNAGATPGTPAYDNAMKQFNASAANSETQAAGAAENTGLSNELGQFSVLQGAGQFGNQASGQEFNQNLESGELGNTAQGQALSQWATKLGIPLQEAQALFSGTQVTMPGTPTAATSSTNAPDVMQAFQNQYQGALNSYNSQVGTNNAMMGDAATIAAAAIASDERVKKDITPLHTRTERGNPLYSFRYRWEGSDSPLRVGVMAQEIEQNTPEAVLRDAQGILHVDYRLA